MPKKQHQCTAISGGMAVKYGVDCDTINIIVSGLSGWCGMVNLHTMCGSGHGHDKCPWRKAWRYLIEVEAYRVQIANGASLDYCVRQLATGYNLDIDFETAKHLLK